MSDDNRFQTAWFYVNENCPDSVTNSNLKRLIVDKFCEISEPSASNKANMFKMVNAIKGNTGDASLKNELSSKLKGISVKGAVQPPSSRGIVHHKEQVEY